MAVNCLKHQFLEQGCYFDRIMLFFIAATIYYSQVCFGNEARLLQLER